MRALNSKDLLFQIPYLQHLLNKLMDCKPTGVAVRDGVVQVRGLEKLPMHSRICIKHCWPRNTYGHCN